MDQNHSISIENNVFDRQQSISDSSTTYLNNNEALIVVWLRSATVATDVNFDSIQSKIETSADLLTICNDDPAYCEKYIRTKSKNVKIFLILSSEYVRTVLENVHDLQLLHSVYIDGEVSNEIAINDYPKVNIFDLS